MSQVEYGYIGATPSQDFITGNSGVFSLEDVSDLLSKDKMRLGSDFIHLETKNVTGTTNIDFTDIKNTRFRTHLIVWDNVVPVGTDNNPLALRFRNQSNSTFFTSNYKVAIAEMYSNSFGAYRGSKNFLRISENTGNASAECTNGFVWIHSAGNANSYTTINAQSTAVWNNGTEIGLLGGGFLKDASVIDGFRIFGENANTNYSGRFTLYGVSGQ